MTQTYIGYYFKISPKSPWDEILLAQLQDLPFESFEMSETGLNAYVAEKDHFEPFLSSISLLEDKELKIEYTSRSIEPENWNTKWEEAFEPIEINSDCVIRADFHPSFNKQYELLINPKMSFGTGHHQTTHMMLDLALSLSLKKMTVLDMGCGTGILAILASKMGAQAVDAIDYDPWCVENAKENVTKNQCQNITVTLGEKIKREDSYYDVIFANINRNVLLEQLPSYAKVLRPKGSLLLSGFYKEDIPIVKERCNRFGLQIVEIKQKESWCALRCKNE
jgi:ribosomal protein L11 methyltransferase